MPINIDNEIRVDDMIVEGAKNLKKKELIGENDGSKKITLRYFIVETDGHTPWHQHDYEQIVRVQKNEGIYVDHDGNEHIIKEGYNIFVPSNKLHQFKNSHTKPFEFICITLKEEKKICKC